MSIYHDGANSSVLGFVQNDINPIKGKESGNPLKQMDTELIDLQTSKERSSKGSHYG